MSGKVNKDRDTEFCAERRRILFAENVKTKFGSGLVLKRPKKTVKMDVYENKKIYG